MAVMERTTDPEQLRALVEALKAVVEKLAAADAYEAVAQFMAVAVMGWIPLASSSTLWRKS